ncbi:MAG: hypothetical protein E7544_00960 [Ruminococcaceae bacterium]|nr:hypothetical protein [Oscillospiraceae bacterium]
MIWYKDSKTKNKLEMLFLVIVLLSISAICFFTATENLMILKDSDSVIVEYQGEFEVRIIEYVRNVNYLFILNNGDKVTVLSPEYISDETFFNFNKCVFKYSKYPNIKGRHNCLGISSLNGVKFLNEESVKSELRFSIIPLYLSALFLLLCALFFVVIEYADKIYKSIKRQQRKKKKRKKKTGDG